ncbi:potassium transporter Kup [Sphingomonas koreensis]|nr:potassium transporter Kup [Sphingomonas koreensis]TPG41376.1 potassium transporter Kup [Sphingomonas koreensis]
MATSPDTPDSGDRRSTLAIGMGALGVVFADIGTSPIYAFREALAQAGTRGIGAPEILGVLSMAIWSLIIVVSIKYVLLLTRANNQGEGGVLALTAIARRGRGIRARPALILGAAGAALFYGDSLITPALSVLAASEGLRTLPGAKTAVSEHAIFFLTIVILIALFAVQARGTERLSRLFGPVCLIWFVTIAALGLWQTVDDPSILRVLSPVYGIVFLAHHGLAGLFVLGAMSLTVAGAEAMTAYMGQFGRATIRRGWFALVLPALMLNYLGQGAVALDALSGATAKDGSFLNADWFFLMAPVPLRIPLIGLAILTTIIASQAVISGAFSLTQQAIQLGLLPRLKVRRSLAANAPKIYLPAVNWLLMVGVLMLIVEFRTSSNMAAAYGIAVTGTMLVTTCLAYIVVRHRWRWSRPRALLLIAPFVALDAIFFAANLLRVIEGGWVPLAIAAVIGLVISIWVRGRGIVKVFEQRHSVPLADLAAALERRPPERVEGVAVFLTSNPASAPGALLHNLKHNKVLHEKNLIVSVRTADRPIVPPAERTQVTRIDGAFTQVVLTYGFMEAPDVPRDLGLEAKERRVELEANKTSYFIGRNTLKPSKDEGMPLWQDRIFMFLQRNASDPTDFLQIPPGKVLELGEQVTV